MGVIHKLKKDVVDFIIDQKKKNPSISIRRLAAETSDKFQIKVSKSSVSNTLKDASLSSAVGRRSTNTTKGEKFSIPVARKTEILQNMQKAGFDKDTTVEEEKKDDAIEKVADVGESAKVQPAKKEETPSLIPDPVVQVELPPVDVRDKKEIIIEDVPRDKGFLERVEQLRNEKKNQKTSTLKGMGFVFLKATQWEISSSLLMLELFKKHASGVSHNNFDIVCEMYLFLKFLGAKTADDILTYQDHGLWQLNKLQAPIPDENETLSKVKELFQWECGITKTSASSMVMEYDLGKKHIFAQTTGFELVLEDGAKFLIDADMSSFSLGGKTPINKSLTWLSNYLISNVYSPIFFMAPGEGKFDQTFYDMIMIFENCPGKKIQKAIVLDEGGKAITEFSTIPVQRRTFLIGVTPKQEEFTQLTNNAKSSEKKPYYHQESDHIVYYMETKTNSLTDQLQQKINDFRVITIWQDKEESPFWAILTNQSTGSGEDILRAYMSRWPYFGEAKQEASEDNCPPGEGKIPINTTHKSGNLELQDIFSDHVHMLSQHCQKHYFPPHYCEMDIKNMTQAVYQLSGSSYATEDHVVISLEIPESSSYRKDIEYALRRVNERHIFDHFGRKLWIEI